MNKDLKILVADDMETVRESISELLQHFGFANVVAAADGDQALELLRAEGADLLITDLDMPNMDGFALSRAIRADDVLKNLPVLFLTADGEKSTIVEAVQSGADDYLLKPFTAAVLEQKIKKIFKE